MKDQVFTGKDLAGALDTASHALGSPADRLRYVVLDTGSVTRIAILSGPTAHQATPTPAEAPTSVALGVEDPRAQIRSLVRDMAEAGSLDLTAEIDETPERVTVRLGGQDASFFLDNHGEVLKAVEHLLQRAFQGVLRPARLVVDCQGYRDWRDKELQEKALALAESVRGDRKPRETEALNSYERRIVHVTLTDAPGIRTFSVGEGSDRRVTIALDEPDDSPATGI